jgi:hypothetical protein
MVDHVSAEADATLSTTSARPTADRTLGTDRLASCAGSLDNNPTAASDIQRTPDLGNASGTTFPPGQTIDPIDCDLLPRVAACLRHSAGRSRKTV